MKRRILLAVPLVAFCLQEVTAHTAPQSDPEAVALMSQVVATYRSLSSYRDRGRSVQTLKAYPTEKDPSTTVIDFTTVFKRPDKFQFSWTSTENYGDGPYSDKSAIWSDGSDGSKAWGSYPYDKNVPVVEESFSMAVAGATGVSQGTAHEIFRLLTDKVGGFRVDQLRGLKIVCSEMISGVDTYVVHGHIDGVSQDLWIGKQDHLIRKGAETQSDGNSQIFERIDIVANQDIPDADFTPGAEFIRKKRP